MKRILLLSLISLLVANEDANAQSKYVIKLKDKLGTPYSISNPSQFLSARSIARRTRQRIAIDETDLPITPRYIDSIRKAGAVTILNVSKWLNQVCIQTNDAAALTKIMSFPFVQGSQQVRRTSSATVPVKDKFERVENSLSSSSSQRTTADVLSYGNSATQIKMHEGEFLHNKGFHGQGMMMAIMDAGFFRYQTITAFDSVRVNGQIKETYDFVLNENSVNEDDAHGMYCFSIIAGNWPTKLVGSCPKADFYLYRTEDVSSEYPIEEQNWIAAAERADSIGVDVFSTSLGYTTFDNPAYNHTYAQMDGNTTMITRASDLASKKGIIVITAAGNEGGSAWRYISAPADADSCIAVGAVTSTGVPANFTSYGPSSDNQVKPTVASMGVATAIAGTNNQPTAGNGTSFATPNLAGLVTCLWQAFPDFTNMEIIEAVKRSSNNFTTPNDRIGYGIPNFRKAFEDLTVQRANRTPGVDTTKVFAKDWIQVFPNPFVNNFTVALKPQNTGSATFTLVDASGKIILRRTVAIQANVIQLISFNSLQGLSRGMYTLRFTDGKNKRGIKLIGRK
jgi:serine protease AprX